MPLFVTLKVLNVTKTCFALFFSCQRKHFNSMIQWDTQLRWRILHVLLPIINICLNQKRQKLIIKIYWFSSWTSDVFVVYLVPSIFKKRLRILIFKKKLSMTSAGNFLSCDIRTKVSVRSNSRKQFIQKQTILSDLYITSVSWIYFKLSWGWINSEKFHRIVIRTYYFPQHTIILSGGYRTISNFQFYFAFLQLYFYNVVIKDWHRFFRDTAFY